MACLACKMTRDYKGREDIFILVNLCLIPLCPLSSCHIPNSFMDGVGSAQVNSDVGQLPGTGVSTELRMPAECPVRAGPGLDPQGRSLIPHLGSSYLCS